MKIRRERKKKSFSKKKKNFRKGRMRRKARSGGVRALERKIARVVG